MTFLAFLAVSKLISLLKGLRKIVMRSSGSGETCQKGGLNLDRKSTVGWGKSLRKRKKGVCASIISIQSWNAINESIYRHKQTEASPFVCCAQNSRQTWPTDEGKCVFDMKAECRTWKAVNNKLVYTLITTPYLNMRTDRKIGLSSKELASAILVGVDSIGYLSGKKVTLSIAVFVLTEKEKVLDGWWLKSESFDSYRTGAGDKNCSSIYKCWPTMNRIDQSDVNLIRSKNYGVLAKGEKYNVIPYETDKVRMRK